MGPLIIRFVILIIIFLIINFSKIFGNTSSKIKPDTRRIVILGAKESGKTTLWEKLGAQLDQSSSIRTGQQKVNQFTIEHNGHTITVCDSIDIGGGDVYVRYYDDIIVDDTFIYYLINGNALVKNKDEEKKIIKSQLEKISRTKKNKKNIGQRILITHSDSMPHDKETYLKNVLSILDRKIIPSFSVGAKKIDILGKINDRVDFVNLLNDQDINKIKDQIICKN